MPREQYDLSLTHRYEARQRLRRGFLIFFCLWSVFAAYVLLSSDAKGQNKFYATPNRGVEGGKGNAQIRMLLDENVSRRSEAAQNASDIDALEGRMGTAEGDISALEASQTAQDGQISNHAGRIGTLESGMADVEGHAKAPMPGTCHDQNAKLRWNTTSGTWQCLNEGDPTVKPFAKNNLPTCSASQLLRSNGSGFQCVNAGESYVITESDPKIGATTSNFWCRGTGSQVTCDQAAPAAPAKSPPTCTGVNQVLQWDGTNWLCKHISVGQIRVVERTESFNFKWGRFTSPGLTSYCSSNERVIGGGGACIATGETANVEIFKISRPTVHNGWFVKCDSSFQENLTITAYAICMSM